jgi:hypothetical protein
LIHAIPGAAPDGRPKVRPVSIHRNGRPIDEVDRDAAAQRRRPTNSSATNLNRQRRARRAKTKEGFCKGELAKQANQSQCTRMCSCRESTWMCKAASLGNCSCVALGSGFLLRSTSSILGLVPPCMTHRDVGNAGNTGAIICPCSCLHQIKRGRNGPFCLTIFQ